MSVHCGQGNHGQGTFRNSLGDRIGIDQKTPDANAYLGGPEKHPPELGRPPHGLSGTHLVDGRGKR